MESKKQDILNLFPETIQIYLKKVSSPLNKQEVLTQVFNEYKIKLCVYTYNDDIDDFDNKTPCVYIELSDVLNILKQSEKDIPDLKKLLKITLHTYSDVINENENESGYKIGEYGVQNENLVFITFLDLIKLINRINTKEALAFAEWIKKKLTIARKILTKIDEIKNEIDFKKIRKENEKYKKEIDKLKEELDEIKKEDLKNKAELKKIKEEKEKYKKEIVKIQKGLEEFTSSEFLNH